MKKLLTLLWLGIFSHLAAFTQIPDDLGIFDGNKASLDVMPSFQGGDLDTFRKWVNANVVYPQLALENGISGRVVTSFVIEKDGSLSNIEIIQSPDKILSAEVMRVLLLAPAWTPGTQKGKVVRVRYTLPCDFSFSDDAPSTKNEQKTPKTPNFDKGIENYKREKYSEAIEYFLHSLGTEKHEIGLVYIYLSFSYYHLSKMDDPYGFANRAVKHFTPISEYLANYKDAILDALYLKANFDFDYSQQRENWKPYALSAVNNYQLIIANFTDSLDAKVFQEINMRCGGLKYILGQSDYRKYLQNGGAEGQEMLQKIIKTQQNPTSTNAKKSTQLIKDKSFKIE